MNFFNLAAPRSEERFHTVLEHPHATIEYIASNRFENGTWYDQPNDEWVILISGEATLAFEGKEVVSLQAGDQLFIAAHERHRVLKTSENARWIAVHLHP